MPSPVTDKLIRNGLTESFCELWQKSLGALRLLSMPPRNCPREKNGSRSGEEHRFNHEVEGGVGPQKPAGSSEGGGSGKPEKFKSARKKRAPNAGQPSEGSGGRGEPWHAEKCYQHAKPPAGRERLASKALALAQRITTKMRRSKVPVPSRRQTRGSLEENHHSKDATPKNHTRLMPKERDHLWRKRDRRPRKRRDPARTRTKIRHKRRSPTNTRNTKKNQGPGRRDAMVSFQTVRKKVSQQDRLHRADRAG